MKKNSVQIGQKAFIHRKIPYRALFLQGIRSYLLLQILKEKLKGTLKWLIFLWVSSLNNLEYFSSDNFKVVLLFTRKEIYTNHFPHLFLSRTRFFRYKYSHRLSLPSVVNQKQKAVRLKWRKQCRKYDHPKTETGYVTKWLIRLQIKSKSKRET